MPAWMVVEDEPDIYDVLLAMFELWGVQGIAFVEGGDAMDWVADVDAGEYTGELPELAMLDIRLPEFSGPAIGERIRSSPKLKDIVIVLITAYYLSPRDEESFKKQAQADALMYKPLPNNSELRARLNALIVERKARLAAPAIDATKGTKAAKVAPKNAKP